MKTFKLSKKHLQHKISYYEKTLENALACLASEKAINTLKLDLQNAKNELKLNYPKS